jgi:hypothetical protein
MMKDIEGYEGRYAVTPEGCVYSHIRKRFIAGKRMGNYLGVVLCGGSGKRKNAYIHRLVCAAFHGPAPHGKEVVNHLDNNPQNNAAINLEWTDMKGNLQHMAKQGRHVCHNRKLSDADVVDIRERRARGEAYAEIAKDFPPMHIVTLRAIACGDHRGHASV